MAISWKRTSYLTRKKGHNAVEYAAKRSNQKLHCNLTNKTYDYTNISDCVFNKIIFPDNVPNEIIDINNHPFSNRQNLWNAIEDIENTHNRRASATLALVTMFALPKELSLDNNVELVTEYIKEQHINKSSSICDLFINDKGDGNPNAITMITLRKLEGLEFGKKKIREMAGNVKRGRSGKAFLVRDSEEDHWADFQNNFFVKKGIDLEVDQPNIIASDHVGRGNTFTVDNIKDKNVSIKEQTSAMVIEKPEIILETLLSRKERFSHHDITSLIKQAVKDDEFDHIYDLVMNHKSLTKDGYDALNRNLYTFKTD